MKQQQKTVLFVNRRINEADRFVSGLIDFLIELY